MRTARWLFRASATTRDSRTSLEGGRRFSFATFLRLTSRAGALLVSCLSRKIHSALSFFGQLRPRASMFLTPWSLATC
jgi:hypothetical protein